MSISESGKCKLVIDVFRFPLLWICGFCGMRVWSKTNINFQTLNFAAETANATVHESVRRGGVFEGGGEENYF